jgi:hypothetical protein
LAWSFDFKYSLHGFNFKSDYKHIHCVRDRQLSDTLPDNIEKAIVVLEQKKKKEVEAKRIRKDLEAKAAKEEELAYSNASSQNTIAAYKAYLKQYPNGANASSAKQNIYELSPASIAQRKKEAKERQDREAREAREQAERDKRACENMYVGKIVKYRGGIFRWELKAIIMGIGNGVMTIKNTNDGYIQKVPCNGVY